MLIRFQLDWLLVWQSLKAAGNLGLFVRLENYDDACQDWISSKIL